MDTEIILAENKRYTVISEYETVYLTDKTNNKKIIIGDFYGDPAGAFIDANEKFVVMYGCGIIVYFLVPPFNEYTYNTKTPQWFEVGRDGNTMWVTSVLQIGDNKIRAVLENGQTEIISVETPV